MTKKNLMASFSPAAQAQQEAAKVETPKKAPPERVQKIFTLTLEQEKRLAHLRSDERTSWQEIVMEGLNRVMAARGLPEL